MADILLTPAPLRRVRSLILSRTADLAPLWKAAVRLAEQSALYTGCERYCKRWDAECGPGYDTVACAVQCVGAGELLPSCADAWATLIGCFADTLTCDELLVEEYAERPGHGGLSTGQTQCETERSAYDDCASP